MFRVVGSPSSAVRTMPSMMRLSRRLATHASQQQGGSAPATRHDWAKTEIKAIYDTPLLDLVYRAAGVHRLHHDPTKIQLPCARCKAILNVPHSLARFACPQCGIDLSVDFSKLQHYLVHIQAYISYGPHFCKY